MLFRVLFATTTIVGGLGVVVYLVLWAAMPGTDATAPVVDRLIGVLGEHRFASGAIVCLGLVAWVSVVQRRPWGVWPVVVTVALGAAALMRRISRDESVHLNASVRLGSVAVDGNHLRSGFGETTTASHGANAQTVDVHLATGSVEAEHVGP